MVCRLWGTTFHNGNEGGGKLLHNPFFSKTLNTVPVLKLFRTDWEEGSFVKF